MKSITGCRLILILLTAKLRMRMLADSTT